MDAMIFAAGLGTRLRPLTYQRPKALVEVGGVTMLERVARRLVDAGADRIIINTHPFPDLISQLVRDRDNFGVDVRFSHEPDQPLDTGGGLRHAAHLFRAHAPILLHNCDVLSDVDLRALHAAHPVAPDAIATLAVLTAATQRYLLFDDAGLCGYAPRGADGEITVRAPTGTLSRHDFTGIHVISPALLATLLTPGPFSIMSHYLSLARAGTRIARLQAHDATWVDIGSHEKLAQADSLVRSGRLR